MGENLLLKFSVIIPTRNRHETIKYSLLSCLNQEYLNYEIIVCDNSTTPETKEVILNLSSEKIKYYKTPESLAMADNWEFALSHATGDYFIVIGDDDALLPGSLNKINTILQKNELNVLRWERVYYSWPSIPVKEVANKLDIPVSEYSGAILRSNEIIQSILNLNLSYTMLPMLYNSAISKKMISQLIKKTGRIFNGVAPDIYSGFAIALLAGEYGSINYPITINAGSAKSNGVNSNHLYGENEIKKDFEVLNKQSQINWPQEVPELSSITCAVMEGYFQVIKQMPEYKKSFIYNFKRVITQIISELNIQSKNDWEDAYVKIKNSIQDSAVLSWFESNYKIDNVIENKPIDYSWQTGYNGDWLFLDASKFAADNVNEVAILSQHIIGERFPNEVYQKVTFKKTLLNKIKNKLFHFLK